ncbi:MAG TPA: hypothetical protein VGU71_17750 [Candidatus Dormibacteraeota bacterium]|nr:hypothetical protein [Candidatus Dormibacteraeota bacterium]
MRAWVLKAGATALTLATTAVSALYVTSHLKNPGAPLQPIVISTAQLSGVSITPGVQKTDVVPVTTTYAS